ncbi:MAG: O-antigen ligase family protein [Candidatus Omnitrophica bacterium]|nr:O-antigen ligase family protein [Candidatus Omnitrophota bacterium]
MQPFDLLICGALGALIFFLPISLALAEVFMGLAVFFFLLKRIVRLSGSGIGARGLPGKERWQRFYAAVRPPDTGRNFWLALFFWACFVSAVFSIIPGRSWSALGCKVVERSLLFFAFIEVMGPASRLGSFLFCGGLSGLCVNLSGLAQFFTGKDFLRGRPLMEGRVGSCLGHPNNFGSYLLVEIFISLALLTFYSSKKIFSRNPINVRLGPERMLWVFLLISTVLSFINLGMTFSRGAWFAFLAMIGIWCCVKPRRCLLGLGMTLIFLMVFLPLSLKVRYQAAVPVSGASAAEVDAVPFSAGTLPPMKDRVSLFDLHGREMFWREAATVIRQRPLAGSGLNTYTQAVKKFDKTKRWYWGYKAHNTYLQTAAEIGIPGCVIFLGLIFSLFYRCKPDGEERADLLLTGARSALAAFLIMDFFDTGFYSAQLNILFWLLSALVVVLSRKLPS